MTTSEEQNALRQELQTEGYSYIGSARQLLGDARGEASDGSTEPAVWDAWGTTLFENTRQLKDKANAAGLLDISNLALQLEAELKRVKESNAPLASEVQEMLLSYVDSIETFFDYYFRNTSNAATIEQLLKAEEGFQLAPQMLEFYLVETREHLSDISTILLNIDTEKVDATKGLEEIFRLVHSIKGDSYALGFKDVGDESHTLESFLSDRQSAGTLESTDVEFLFAKLEELSRLVDQVAAGDEATASESSGSSADVHNLYLKDARSAISRLDDLLGSLDAENPSAREELLQETLVAVQSLVQKSVELDASSDVTADVSPVVLAVKVTEKSITKALKKPTNISNRFLQSMRKKYGQLVQALDAFDKEGSEEIAIEKSAESSVAVAAPSAFPPHEAQEPPVDMDIPEEVRDIYLEESQEIMDSVSQTLLELERQESTDIGEALQDAYRAIHTLKGNSNALGVNWVGDAADEMETFLSELRDNPDRFNPSEMEEIFWRLEKVQMRVRKLTQPAKTDESLDSHNTGVEAYQPEAGTDIPEEIRDIYLIEAQELIETVSQTMLDLEQEKVELIKALEEIYRAVHTLKGNSNALGVTWIGEAAHDMETFMSELRDNPATFDAGKMERLFYYLDIVRTLVEQLTQEQTAVEPEATESNTSEDLLRTTLDTPITKITQSNTSQQVVAAVKREKRLFDELEKKISTGSGSLKVDLKTTQETKKSKVTPSSSTNKDDTIRVAVNKVDKLINLSDELLINKIAYQQRLVDVRSMLSVVESARQEMKHRQEHFRHVDASEMFLHLQDVFSDLEDQINWVVKNFKNNNTSFSLLVEEIQYTSRNMRMLTASNLINPLRLVVRNTSSKLGKKVHFQVVGEEIELDRLLIEKLKDPLAHILRNALDHGIESSAERVQAGKDAKAVISIAISLSGNNIVFQIHDDGCGIDFTKVRDKAIRLGLVTSEQAAKLSDHDLSQLMFIPGFSTADQVTDVSGRGVGLDVVKNTVEGMNGTVTVISDVQRGTIFTISLPVTLTTFDAFLVQIAEQTFALPRSAVLSSVAVKSSDLAANSFSKAIYFDGVPIKLVSLKNILGLPGQKHDEDEVFALIVESNRMRFALVVDQVLEAQEMVMKNLGSQLRKVPYVSGATLMGSGEPVVVLNIAEIVNKLSSVNVDHMSVMLESSDLDDSDKKNQSRKKDRKTRVLVVDDSVTTRTLEKNILEAAGFEVLIGKNGLEGKQQVQNLMPDLDLVITDVEMPKMNGYQFASWLKKESEYRDTPVIMVSSLASDELKAKGFESGIDAYIVKGEFNQKVLLETVYRLLKEVA